MRKPLVSVLIDTYNHERYIEQAITSVLEQDFPSADFEILIVDDGSTDRTGEIVRKFVPRVRLLQKKNGGQASAFNAGIPETRAEVVAFLDGDDWFVPGKLTAVMNALEENPDAVAVGHGRYDFEEGTGEVRICAPPQRKFLRPTTPEAAREAFKHWPFLMTSAITARKKFLNQIVPIPEALTFYADTAMTLASMAQGACILEQPLYYYRLHSDNLHSVDPQDVMRLRRRLEMNELSFELALPILLRIGVHPDAARALVCPNWIYTSRHNLATFGGSRLKALRTEMLSFRSNFENPSTAYRLFKYLVVAPVALLLPPRRFYKLREWYAQRNLVPIREQFAKSRKSGRSRTSRADSG